MGGISRAENLTKANIKGIEIRGQLFLKAIHSSLKNITANASIAFAKGEGKVRQHYVPLNSISPLTAIFGFTYKDSMEKWGSQLFWTLVKGKDKSDIYAPNNTASATPGYGVLDLTTFYKPAKKLTLQAGLFNLTNKKYWLWSWARLAPTNNNRDRYSEPGRNVSVSLKYEI